MELLAGRHANNIAEAIAASGEMATLAIAWNKQKLWLKFRFFFNLRFQMLIL
jgi:hypothetical protein